MRNISQSSERQHRYEIDPKEFLDADKLARENGEEVAAVYHSHPNGPSRPSQFDLLHAWPEISYIVIEIKNGKPISTNSWILNEDRSDFKLEQFEVRN